MIFNVNVSFFFFSCGSPLTTFVLNDEDHDTQNEDGEETHKKVMSIFSS